MQEKDYDRNPALRRKLGYVTGAIRQGGVSGGDTVYTLIKAGIILVIGASVLSAASAPIALVYALPIIVGAAAAIPVFVGSKLLDEYDRNQAEAKQVSELEFLNKKNTRLANIIDNELAALSDIKLLKLVLNQYLKSLALDQDAYNSAGFSDKLAHQRTVGFFLPNQRSMIRLIESFIPGTKYGDPSLAGKFKQLLQDANPNNDQEETVELTKKIIKVLQLGDAETPPISYLLPQKKKTLYNRVTRLVKNTMSFVASFNTAGWLVFGSAFLLNFLVFGHLAAIPLLAVGIAVGITSGIAAVIYARYVEKPYKKNQKKMEEIGQQAKVRHEMLLKLNNLQSKKYDLRDSFHSLKGDALQSARSRNQLYFNPVFKASFATRARVLINRIAFTFYGLAVGGVIGMGIGTICLVIIGHAIIPIGGLALSIASAVGGAIFAPRYSRIMNKSAKKEGQDEIKIEEKVLEKRFYTEKHLEQLGIVNAKARVNDELKKTKQLLVKELLEAFIAYKVVAAREGYTPELINMRQEKLLNDIEVITGKKREIVGENPINDTFLQELGLYLLEDKALARTSIADTISKFKGSVLNQEPQPFQIIPPSKSIRKTWKEGLFSANRFAMKHLYPLLGAMGIAFAIGAIIFGAPAFYFIITGIPIVLTIYAITKVTGYYSAKNIKNLHETANKLSIVEKIASTNSHTNQITAKRRKAFSLNVVQVPEPQQQPEVRPQQQPVPPAGVPFSSAPSRRLTMMGSGVSVPNAGGGDVGGPGLVASHNKNLILA